MTSLCRLISVVYSTNNVSLTFFLLFTSFDTQILVCATILYQLLVVVKHSLLSSTVAQKLVKALVSSQNFQSTERKGKLS